MARKSRRKNQVFVQKKSEARSYKAGIYTRVSVADGELESTSIQNQILIAKKYLDEQGDIALQEIYVDEGQTGTNFERPAFLRLLRDISEKSIDCVVVKDFSRFGRNYLEVGRFLEDYFPKHKVRFISVNDQFDSIKKEQQDDLILPLKGIVNDSYAKDISKKVSTALAVKKKSGEFLGGKSPYGYRRSPMEKHRLEVVKGQAEVVKQIYAWRLEGLGVTAIAKRLNDLEIPSWRKLKFLEGAPGGREDALWRGASVMGVLKNPCYMGCLVERKTEQVLYKGGIKKDIPRDKWRILEDTHQPIISREIFAQVQASFDRSLLHQEKVSKIHECRGQKENIFKGKIHCGICGGIMQRSSGYFVKNSTAKKYAFYCPKKYLKVGECKTPSVEERKLSEILITLCNVQVELFLDERERQRWTQLNELQGNGFLAVLNKEDEFQIIVKPNYICVHV